MASVAPGYGLCDNYSGAGYPSCCRVMGNAVANGVPAPNSNSTLLRLRRGKKSAGCPCFLAEHAPTWETLTLHDKFRSYVLRHLLDEGFICSVLEHGEREHALAACAGVQYYEYMEESQRGLLRDKLEAWQRAAGAGVTSCDALNAESAFGELQLARPLHAYGFLPTLQRRLAVLRELGPAVAEEHRSRCRPFHMRLRSRPQSAGGQQQGDVRLALMMNAVALQSLSTLASLATTLQALPSGEGTGRSNVDLIRAPFAMLADMLEGFPPQNLFKYWSPLPSEPEKRVSVDPETATASCSASLARLAVSGGLHVGWKSTATGSSTVTWQVALSVPATELTSVIVQWGPGDPASSTDQNAVPLALSIEASVNGGHEWQGITGGGEAVDVALAQKASLGSSRHRYPVSLLGLRRKRDPHRKEQVDPALQPITAVTHVRLKMKGATASRSGGALRIYDVAINAPDPSASPSDVMTVLRQVQTFLLTQHSQRQTDLQVYILRALLAVCQASCALEFELDLVRVYMDIESAASPSLLDGAWNEGDTPAAAARENAVHSLGQQQGLQAFVSTLLLAAGRAKRQACRQDRERIIRDAGFDAALSSRWVVVSECGQLVSSAADGGHSHSLLQQCLRRGVWSWELALERENSGDETTCVGVAVNPVTNSYYEDSHQMWMIRCYSGETYSNGGRRNHMTRKIHPQDSVRLTLNCEAGTLSLDVNGVDQGVVFSNVPPEVHPAVCFYGCAKSVRLVELKRIYSDSDGDTSDSEDESDEEGGEGATCRGGEEKQAAPLSQRPLQQQQQEQQEQEQQHPEERRQAPVVSAEDSNNSNQVGTSVSPGVEPRGNAGDRSNAGKHARGSHSNLRRRKSGREEAVSSFIRGVCASSPSRGLLASLANLAQWYVPRCEEDTERDEYGATEQRSDVEEGEGDRMNRLSETVDSAHAVSRSMAATPSSSDGGGGIAWSGEPLDFEARRYFSVNNANVNESGGSVGGGTRQSTRFPNLTMARPLPFRRMVMDAADTGTAQGLRAGADFSEWRTLARAPGTAEAVGPVATAGGGVQGSKGKPLALEEPHIIQPTAAVFQKLYDLLVRSLSCLQDGTNADRMSAASTVLSLLQIMRANFCRLVDAHVDPAELDLLLDYNRQRHVSNDAPQTGPPSDGRERLLPNILHCLQDIMLQQEGDPVLLRATVDTFTSGLPLLMPLVADRLHLLLGLVWHLKSTVFERSSGKEKGGATKRLPSSGSVGHDSIGSLAQIPRERMTLLRDLLRHFARTESVLQLLALFEEDEAERSAVSDLLELMLTSMADKACPFTRMAKIPQREEDRESVPAGSSGVGASLFSRARPPRMPPGDPRRPWPIAGDSAQTGNRSDQVDDGVPARVSGEWGGQESHWDHLVAKGAGGTTLNFTLLDTCQQHLLCMVLKRDRTEDNPHELLLCQYGQCLLHVCCRVLTGECSPGDDAEDNDSPWWQLVGVLLPPFLHGVCMCVDRPRIAEGLLPPLVRLSEVLSERISRNLSEEASASMAEDILRQTQLTHPQEGLALAPSGWHPVKASFEVDKESMTSFTISEDGQLYSALTSSNTCALVDVGVSQGKAAWEFLLEDDSPSDECSVFGIATKPPYSRCYNSSQSLWMRRAYNGVLYNRGRQLPPAQSMPKIHPGDVVRCEVDMDDGTVRFSVNGDKQDGGFDDVEGEVFPCAGSYRSGVTIRLLKMEIMGGIGLRRSGYDGLGAAFWDPTEIAWAPAPCCKLTRGGLVSIDKKAMEVKRMAAPLSLHRPWAPRPAMESRAARTSVSVSHRTSSVGMGTSGDASTAATATGRQHTLAPEPTDEGATSGPKIDPGAPVGMVEVADADSWDWVSVRASRGFAASKGKHSVEMEVTPVGTRRRRPVRSSRPCGSEDMNSLRRYPMAFGLCAGSLGSLDGPIGHLKGSWGWWSDGSLRAHGEVVIPAGPGRGTSDEETSAALYGADFLPLKQFDVITMIADTAGGTVRYLVNGVDAGVAFGPLGSGAACELEDDKAPFTWEADAILFPSCSLSNDKQVVQLRAGGTLGTQLWPLSLDLQKTVASLAGRLCATMVAGTPHDEAEVALEPWLRSPLLSGGVQASDGEMGDSAWRSLGRRTWDEAWEAEQGRRLLRANSVVAFGSEDGIAEAHPEMAWGEPVATVCEEECASVGAQSPPLVSVRELRLIARIVQATEIPQGLILWPDTSYVRLTAVVDGRDVACQKEVLAIAKTGSTATAGETGGVEEAKDSGNNSKGKIGEVGGSDQLRPGLTELVLTLGGPKTQAVLDRDGASDSVPALSLRVEVLVGRAVTAEGAVDLGDVLKTSLSKASNTHTKLSLQGGGEMVFALSFDVVEPSFAGVREEAAEDQAGAHAARSVSEDSCARVTGDDVELGRATGPVGLELFLENIACWGLAEGSIGSAASRDNHNSSPSAVCVAQEPLASVSAGDSSVGGSLEEVHLPSGNLDRTVFPKLLEWLSQIHPDPTFLRLALEKTDNYSFPSVEAPYLAALLKHGGLLSEAFQAVEMMASEEKEGSESRPPPPSPTKDMAKLWGRVRQLRSFLRTQRQEYKVAAADSPPAGGGNPAVDSNSAVGAQETTQARTGRDEDEQKEAGSVAEEKGESPEKAQQPVDHVERETFPATFDDLCLKFTERANFLLELSPSTVDSPHAAAEGTSVLMHHLAEELSDLPASPPSTIDMNSRLQSSLLRWRSEDRGKEQWKGVVDVLRVRTQLRRSLSMACRPRAKSLGNRPAESALPHSYNSERSVSKPCIREGQIVNGRESPDDGDFGPIQTSSVGQADGDSGCNSGDDSDGSGKGALLDNETASSAAMQACMMYVITGGAVAPPRVLRASLRNRTVRASMRTFGLEALAALLRSLAPGGEVSTSRGAPSALQEALVFLRPAFQGLRMKRNKEGKEVEISSDERDTRHHYLKGLEGCSAGLLARVQTAFESLYGLLRTLLDHSLRTVQPGLAHVLMTTWALDFESRDYRFLAHESGILPTLQAMVTLTNTANMANSALASLSDAPPKQKESWIEREASARAAQRWTPWSLENVREGFIQGTLLARDLAHHISVIPASALPSGFLQAAGLHGSASDILRRHSMASLTTRYSALLRVHLKHAEAKIEKAEQAAASKKKRLEEIARERVAQMVNRGVPVLDERDVRKATEVQLTALCSWATVPMVASVACTFARGVTYACKSAAGEAPVGIPASANSANYFEVTVMNPGEKTTIGIGLADPDIFPATKQMPGWVDHSYGYHGDDGRKFGRGKTDTIWPIWADGDVIGCGFDPVRGAIWYTRNGKLLGDGFVPVHEYNLVPVVGFHSNGESVRVNFGIVPFAYEGPEVVVAPAVLAERELMMREARDLKLATASPVSSDDGDQEALEEGKMKGKLEEGKEEKLAAKVTSLEGVGRKVDDREEEGAHRHWGRAAVEKVSPETMAPSMKLLQRGASSLLRFLVAVSMRQASLAGAPGSQDASPQAPANEAPSRAEDSSRRQAARGGPKLSNSKASGMRRSIGGTSGLVSATALPMPQTRERSMYGTPFKEMQVHVDNLHQDIFDVILRELRLGALSLEHIVGTSPRQNKANEPHKYSGPTIDGDVDPSCLGTLAASERGVKAGVKEMQRSYSHGYCQRASGGRNSTGSTAGSTVWKGLCGTSAVDSSETSDTRPDCLNLVALEIGEVEPCMFRQLALLCSLREYSITRSHLAHPSALRSIFSLLKNGSPRIQRCVLLLLCAIIPGMEPSVVDACLPEGWVGREETGAPSSSFHHTAKSGARKDQEIGASINSRSTNSCDGLVGVLFSSMRRAYSPPVSAPVSPAPESVSGVDARMGGASRRDDYDDSSANGRRRGRGQGLLHPGCDQGFGVGTLDLCLAEQCGAVLRVLYKEPAWKELIARKLLLCIRTAASTVRVNFSSAVENSSSIGSSSATPMGAGLLDIMFDAVAALSIIASSSGVLFPGATVQSKSGAMGTVVQVSAGDAEAGVVFDGENVEACEKIRVQDLEATGVGFQADPDTPAQPVVAQLLSLLGALLQSDEVFRSLKTAGPERLGSDIRGMVWSRMLSQTLRAVLQLSVHCSDAVVAACEEGDVVTRVLPTLLQVAVCPIQLPTLMTAQDFALRWRSAQARMLSALHLGSSGLRTLQPIQKQPLPPSESSSANEESGEKPAVAKPRRAHSPSDGAVRDVLSAEESREEALMHPTWRNDYGDAILEVGRPARSGGRGRAMTLSDAHRPWGRGWGSSAAPSRYSVAARGMDWVGRLSREEDDARREGSRYRLLRGDTSRLSTRGRRAASAESRLELRRSAGRTFYEYDRLGGFAEYKDEDSGALLVEFNDAADGPGREAPGVEGTSAGSADSGDTSQDGDEENSASNAAVRVVDGGIHIGRGSRPTSPEHPYYVGIAGERSVAPIKWGGDRPPTESGSRPPLPGFPISHVLEFDTASRAERQVLSSRLSSEFGVPETTALAALEAFGPEFRKARMWLQTKSKDQQVPDDAPKVPAKAAAPSSVGGDLHAGELNGDSETSGTAADDAIVGGLVGTGDAESVGRGGESASATVPSAEEGLNLWDPEEGREATPPRDVTSMQRASLLCEHDLVPVLGVPRLPTGVGGPTGTVTSFLVSEVDVLAPGSLLLLTSGEGCTPGKSCPSVTVAGEIDYSAALGHEEPAAVGDVSGGTKGHGIGWTKRQIQRGRVPSPAPSGRSDDSPSSNRAVTASVVNEEEVLVNMMDAETGLCLGKRVPVGELRHSTSFFGLKLDNGGTTVKQVLRDTDIALSVLGARSLVVRLINSLPTPAIPAAGGPSGLLHITRLLAAQDLAKGDTPASISFTIPDSSTDHAGVNVEQLSVRSVPGDSDSKVNIAKERDRKLADRTCTPQTDQDLLLKVLWRKVMESPQQWASNGGQAAGSAALGELLAQEVLDSFKMLTTTSQTMLSMFSGDRSLRGISDASNINFPSVLGTSVVEGGKVGAVSDAQEPARRRATESIVHESVHPLLTPLSYGGHIKVDPKCHGMVVKLDSRSRTSSDLLRLRFFSSKRDMLGEHNPLRVMHGYVPERSARVLAKGMEFFKIEEADSTLLDSASSSAKDPMSLSALAPLTLPPALVRQSSTSTTASLGSPTPLTPAPVRRPELTGRAMLKAVYDLRSQMIAKRKARMKEAPVSSNESKQGGNSFRSFALPGVVELWFRFDAPPGAEKPLLQIVSLAGSLDLAQPGLVKAGDGDSDGNGDGNGVGALPASIMATARDDHDEDSSQGGLGLQFLFTCSDDEGARGSSLRADASGKSDKGSKGNGSGGNNGKIADAGADERSKFGRKGGEHDRSHDRLALPGCLASPVDVLLTSGKWFYEATVESLSASVSAGDEVDGCLIRVGWTHAEIAASLQIGSTSKVSEGSLARDATNAAAAAATTSTTTTGAGQATEAYDSSEGSDGGSRMRHECLAAGAGAPGHGQRAGRPTGKGLGLLESEARSSLARDGRLQSEEAALPSNVTGRGAGGRKSAQDSSEVLRIEARSKSVVFPMLGSDKDYLGFGIGQQGFVWLGGSPRVRPTAGFARSDVLGCALDVDSGMAWFSVNGVWASGGMMKSFGWRNDVPGVVNGIRPCFSVRGKSSLSVNFGAMPFKHPPPMEGFLPVILRDVQIAKLDRPGLAARASDSKVVFAPKAARNPPQPQSKTTAAGDVGIPGDWGFRFVVEPLHGVHYRVVREFELICRLGGGARASAGSLTPRAAFGSQVISIWRPKAPPGWFSVGDVTSRGLSSPAGAVVVKEDATGCLVSKPAKFRMVYQDKTAGYMVWRPVARKGQVSLGDFACAKKPSKTVMAGAIRCVAAWAVEACPVVQCLWREKQSGTQAIWSVENGLGTFFGSQTGGRLGQKEVTQGPQSRVERHKRKKKKKKKKSSAGEDSYSSEEGEGESVKLQFGVGAGWALKGATASCMTNEWCQESDVIAGPLAHCSRSSTRTPPSPPPLPPPPPTQPSPSLPASYVGYSGQRTGRVDETRIPRFPPGIPPPPPLPPLPVRYVGRSRQRSGRIDETRLPRLPAGVGVGVAGGGGGNGDDDDDEDEEEDEEEDESEDEDEDKDETVDAEIIHKPRPSVSWASWLLSFLLNHRPLRSLAMRGSLFRTLVAYLRSPGAPHRLRMIPLLTLLVRSHAEFKDTPPPLEELSGLLAAVLRECDKLTCGRGPGSAAWRSGDCPGGLQLETKWANSGLLLLSDLAMATRRAQDSIRQQRSLMQALKLKGDEKGFAETRPEDARRHAEGEKCGQDQPSAPSAQSKAATSSAAVTGGAVRICVPPFGTRLDESPLEEEGEEEADEAERSLADRVLVGGSLLSAEDRALLEVDLQKSLLPDLDRDDSGLESKAPSGGGDLQETEGKAESPSRCLHHLLEIMDTLDVLAHGWPSRRSSVSEEPLPSVDGRSPGMATTPPTRQTPLSLDSLLCEAWMDAVGPAVVVESEHPFRKGTVVETLHFPGAEELVVFLDPRSSMQQGTASLVLEGKDKMISLTGHQEAPWSDVITFRGDTINSRFVAETDGHRVADSALAGDPEQENWGFRFTVVAKGHVWECTTIEGELPNDATATSETTGYEARMKGSLSLLVELDQSRPLPSDCCIQIMSFVGKGTPFNAGTLSESNSQTPIYVEGDRVMLVPSRNRLRDADAASEGKEEVKPESAGGDAGEALAGSSASTQSNHGLSDPMPEAEPAERGDLDGMPDADAKLERLPSDTPVLRPWGEATGVEPRWGAGGRVGNENDPSGPAASYASNAGTVEVGDSDMESKEGSSNNSPASSLGEHPAWSRCSTLNDLSAMAVPILSCVSSDNSEATNLWAESGQRAEVAGTTTAGDTGSMEARGSQIDGHSDETGLDGLSVGGGGGGADEDGGGGGKGGGDGAAAEEEGIYAERNHEVASNSISGHRSSAEVSRPCGVNETKHCEPPEATPRQEGEGKPSPAWKWAVQVRAAAMPRKARLQLYLEQRLSLASRGPSLEEASEWMRMWTPEMDKGLLELLGAAGTKSKEEATSGRVSDTLNPWCCRLTRAEANFQQQRLAAVPAASLHIRAALLLRLNHRIERVLPVIDFASDQEDSLGWQLREMNHFILPHVKNAVLEAALAATQGPGDGVAVTLDNMKAMMSRDRGEKDLASSQCVFAQAYRQLSDTDPKLLRTVWDGERVFHINFVGEDGVDAGGVFREGMSSMVEDLFSADLDLLIQCPNGRHAVGQNNEKFVPNPQHSSPLALSMLRFVGRLMGLSLRTRLCLPFELPGLIWKRVLGLRVGFEDLRMVDTIICQFITAIQNCEEDGLTSDHGFREMYGERLFFTYTGSDGVERELSPGGAARRVTFENRLTFCRQVEQARTHEFDAQAAAMAAGLSDIVPMKVLRLFTAAQLEIAVAGEPEFDIAFWKEHTEYKGYRSDHGTVEFFWKVIESMSREDQSGFVRFAWGRSRLPPKAFWRVNMKLMRSNTSEESLPVSHTCFFSIELPPYSTEERMRQGLLTAIHFGMGGILIA